MKCLQDVYHKPTQLLIKDNLFHPPPSQERQKRIMPYQDVPLEGVWY